MIRAEEEHQRLDPYFQFCSSYAQSWNEIEKKILRMLGAINSSYVREPSVPLPSECELYIGTILKGLGLKPKI
jgi:dihydrodipicolinate synthase/N-acetylneuraminate lyase